MDDFLHNLRSGKLKQPDRSSRPYGDQNYKNTQRRNMMDRRKREYANKESFERMEAIKEVLENLTESQRRMADAYEARTRAEERKARAMEVLAKNFYRMLNPNAEDVDDLFTDKQAAEMQAADFSKTDDVSKKEEFKTEEFDEVENADLSSDTEEFSLKSEEPVQNFDTEASGPDEKKNVSNRQDLMKMISGMREDGNSWENIAREIVEKGYPTVSGRGTWRGVMVKNFFEKMESE